MFDTAETDLLIQGRETFFIDAFAIIFDTDLETIRIGGKSDRQHTAFTHMLEAMSDGIFHQRLDREFGDLNFGHRSYCLKSVLDERLLLIEPFYRYDAVHH